MDHLGGHLPKLMFMESLRLVERGKEAEIEEENVECPFGMRKTVSDELHDFTHGCCDIAP